MSDDDRTKRRAAALRDNLKRRKAQSRALAQPAPVPPAPSGGEIDRDA